MIGTWMKGAAAAVALVVVAHGGEARAQAPVEAYAAAPTFEKIELSPSGDLVARINVIGEQRAVIVTNLSTGENLAAARDPSGAGVDDDLRTARAWRCVDSLGKRSLSVDQGNRRRQS